MRYTLVIIILLYFNLLISQDKKADSLYKNYRTKNIISLYGGIALLGSIEKNLPYYQGTFIDISYDYTLNKSNGIIANGQLLIASNNKYRASLGLLNVMYYNKLIIYGPWINSISNISVIDLDLLLGVNMGRFNKLGETKISPGITLGVNFSYNYYYHGLVFKIPTLSFYLTKNIDFTSYNIAASFNIGKLL